MTELKYRLQPLHWRAYLSAAGSRLMTMKQTLILFGPILLVLLWAGTFGLDSLSADWPKAEKARFVDGAFLGGAIFYGLVLLLGYVQKRNQKAAPPRAFRGAIETSLQVSDEGVSEVAAGRDFKATWEEVDSVEIFKEVAVIWLNISEGIVVPGAAFPDKAAQEDFVKKAASLAAEARSA